MGAAAPALTETNPGTPGGGHSHLPATQRFTPLRKSQTPSQIQDALAQAWVQLKRHGDAKARDFIIEHYRYLITKTRQRIIPSVPTKIAPEDLEQEGLIALVKAVDQFDPGRNVKFESYAISMVRGAMLEYLRKEDWVPRSVRTKQKMLARAEEALTLERGEEITDEDRAAYLELDIDQFYALYFEATVMQIVSLEDVVGDTEHEDLDPLVVLESVRSPDPDPHLTTIVNEQRRLLHQCVNWLPKPEQTVIRMYYYQGMTLKQIAKEIGRSESRAHQLHAQAIMRLSGFLSRQRGLFFEIDGHRIELPEPDPAALEAIAAAAAAGARPAPPPQAPRGA
jgi:RNA polymerase sigma factor for flagellar operon FliA